jgi:hypothetical protein
MSGETIVETLIRVFPRRAFEGRVAPHDCPVCRELQGQLTGITWPDVPAAFIRDRPDVLPLLTPEAYHAFLPAWLHQGLIEPEGEVAGMLLVNLACHPEPSGFTVEQRKAVLGVARFLVENDGWGPEDPENVKSSAAIERTWGAPQLGVEPLGASWPEQDSRPMAREAPLSDGG